MKKIVGIVGGMGPMATVEVFKKIVEHTDSNYDQGHIRILIDDNPQIPDRTQAILNHDKSPVREICKSANGLVGLGAEMILIPCNTSHYFFDEIQQEIPVEVINMVSETAGELAQKNIKCAGLLATTGTITGRIYHKYFEEKGINLISPTGEDQEAVMDFIYSGVKASNHVYNTERFNKTVNHLLSLGAETLVLGCTELPVGLQMYNLNFPNIDSLDVLAMRAVEKAGYKRI